MNLNKILITIFFILTLVIPEISSEYNIRIFNVGVIFLHDFTLFFLLSYNFKEILYLISNYRDKYIRMIYLFLFLLIFWGIYGLFNNPITYVLREIRFLGYSIFFFLTVVIFERDYNQFFRISIFIGVLVSIRGISEQIIGGSLVQNEFVVDEAATLVNLGSAQGFRSYINIILVFTISYSFYQFAQNKSLVYLLIFVINIICLIFSYARNQYLAVLFSLSTLFFLRKRKVFNFLFAATVPIILIIMIQNYIYINLLSDLLGRFSLISDTYDGSNYARILELSESIIVFFQNPLFGQGLGYKMNYWFMPLKYQEMTGIHNTYLFFLVNTGIIGFIFFLLIIINYLKLSFGSIKYNPESITIFASLIGIFISIIFAHHLSGSFFTGWLFSLLGIQYLIYIKYQKGNSD